MRSTNRNLYISLPATAVLFLCTSVIMPSCKSVSENDTNSLATANAGQNLGLGSSASAIPDRSNIVDVSPHRLSLVYPAQTYTANAYINSISLQMEALQAGTVTIKVDHPQDNIGTYSHLENRQEVTLVKGANTIVINSERAMAAANYNLNEARNHGQSSYALALVIEVAEGQLIRNVVNKAKPKLQATISTGQPSCVIIAQNPSQDSSVAYIDDKLKVRAFGLTPNRSFIGNLSFYNGLKNEAHQETGNKYEYVKGMISDKGTISLENLDDMKTVFSDTYDSGDIMLRIGYSLDNPSHYSGVTCHLKLK